MIKSIIYKIWFGLMKFNTITINDNKYYLHHNSVYYQYGMIRHGNSTVYGYTDSFNIYELTNIEKINNLYHLLLSAKHIFLNYNLFDCYITIYNEKYGWITYQYCHRNDCIEIHIYNYCVIYKIYDIYNVKKEFSSFLINLTHIAEKNNVLRKLDFT